MRTIVKMAHRSDRREGKPRNLWDTRVRLNDWLLARGFHFGQDGNGSFAPNPLHTQAGDTSARLTYRCQRRRSHREGWNKPRIRGPTLKTPRRRQSLGQTPSPIAPSRGPRCSHESRLPSLRSAATPAWTRAPLRGLSKYGRWANGGLRAPGSIHARVAGACSCNSSAFL